MFSLNDVIIRICFDVNNLSVEYRDVSEIEIKHTCAYRTHSHLFHPFMGAVAQYHLKPNGFIVSYVCGVMMMRLMK